MPAILDQVKRCFTAAARPERVVSVDTERTETVQFKPATTRPALANGTRTAGRQPIPMMPIRRTKAVRAELVRRSRQEHKNNGYMDGAETTHADYLVRGGPTLQVLTAVDGFNTAVETIWQQWTEAVFFRRKLHCMAEAKTRDGESLAIIRDNPRVRHPITLDFVPIETEQCQTPMLPWGEVGYIDGMRKFDQWGSVRVVRLSGSIPADVGLHGWHGAKRVPADWVMHWFRMRRPGQHRGCRSWRQR